MSDVSQIVTLVGHVGLFQDIDFTPDQQRGEKQHCDKTSVNHMRRASQVVALFNFNRSGLSIFLSQYVAQTSRRQRPGLCRYPGRFRVEHAAPLRCVSPCYFPAPRRLLTALTPASTTAPMIKPSTRLATTGSVEAITPPNPALQCSMA